MKIKHSDLINLAADMAGTVRQLAKDVGILEANLHRWNLNNRIPKKENYDKLVDYVGRSIIDG